MRASGTVVLSIAAGVRLATLEAAFPKNQAIVRAMPNTPAQVGMSMTVAVPNANVTNAEHDVVEELLSAIGKLAWIDDEALIDAVTAVSGSGPAYVFLLAECLAEAAREAGLSDDLADLLARQTVAGAGALLAASAASTGRAAEECDVAWQEQPQRRCRSSWARAGCSRFSPAPSRLRRSDRSSSADRQTRLGVSQGRCRHAPVLCCRQFPSRL